MMCSPATFQIVQEYEDTYYSAFRETEERVRGLLTSGLRHVHEAKLKEQRRTHGHPHHTAEPGQTV